MVKELITSKRNVSVHTNESEWRIINKIVRSLEEICESSKATSEGLDTKEKNP